MVSLMPHLKQSARAELIRNLRRLAGYQSEPAGNHDQAWNALRGLIGGRR